MFSAYLVGRTGALQSLHRVSLAYLLSFSSLYLKEPFYGLYFADTLEQFALR